MAYAGIIIKKWNILIKSSIEKKKIVSIQANKNLVRDSESKECKSKENKKSV